MQLFQEKNSSYQPILNTLLLSLSFSFSVLTVLLVKLPLQLSFGPIGWLMISEVFPLRVRGKGLSIAVLVNFGANALVTFAFSPLKVLKFSKQFRSQL